MSNKWKACLSMFIFALSLFMLVETQYLPPLGDLLLESIGLKAWTNGDSRFHLAFLYFGFVAMISYIFMKRYAYVQMKMKGMTIFIILILLLTTFTYLTSTTAQYLKKNSNGLSAVVLVAREKARTMTIYNSNKNEAQPINNTINYNTSTFEVTDFEIDVTLKNYGKNDVTFFIEFEPYRIKDEPVNNLEIRNKDGSKAEFMLEPGKTHRFVITEDLYQLTGGMRGDNASYSMNVSEVILSNDRGDAVLLTDTSIIAELLILK